MSDSFVPTFDRDPSKSEHASEPLKRRLIFRFQHNLSPEAEDLAQETLVRVLGKMPPHLKGKDFSDIELIQFTFGVARKVAQEGYRRAMWGARTEGFPDGANSDERFSSRKPDPEASFLAKERRESVQPCLRKLSAPDRELFLSYYLDENTVRNDMAQSRDLSIDGLRTRIFRIMNRVRECVRKQVAKQKT